MYPAIAKLDSTHFVVSWKLGTATKTKVLSVSGTTISSVTNTHPMSESSSDKHLKLVALDSMHWILAWSETTGNSKVGSYSGSTISYGSEQQYESDGAGDYLGLCYKDSTHFHIVYECANNSNYGTYKAAVVSGSSISYGSSNVYNNTESRFNSIADLEEGNLIVAYQDVNNYQKGKARAYTIPPTKFRAWILH